MRQRRLSYRASGRSDRLNRRGGGSKLALRLQRRARRFSRASLFRPSMTTSRGMGRGTKAAVLLVAIASSLAACAQASTKNSGIRDSGARNSGTTFFLHERLRATGWGWFAAPPKTNNYSYTASLLRFGLAQEIRNWDWQVEMSQPAVLGLPSDAISPNPAQGQLGLGGTYYAANGKNAYPAAAFLKSAWARYAFHRHDTSARLGRFEFFDGEEIQPKNQTIAWLQKARIGSRLIGNFAFADAQRSFDGADAHIGLGAWDLTAFAARADQGVFNMNGNPELNVDVQYLALTRAAAGGHVLARVFGIGYHDGRTGILKVDNRPLAIRQADHKNIRLGTYGGNLLAAVPAGPGQFDFLFWGVLQNGRWGSESDGANAAALEGGYRFTRVASKPWLRAGWFRSSGDTDPLDRTHGTFFQVLTTPRPYARFPFYNLMNSTDSFVQVIDAPAKSLILRSDVHWLSLTSSSDFWYHGGGASDNKTFGYAGQPSNGHAGLARVADISADWKVTSNVGLSLYYSHASGGGVIQSVYPAGPNAQFGYVELDYQWKHKF